MNLVGEKIRAYRKASGLSQKALASKLGVHWRTVQDWEAGRIRPSWEVAERLRPLLGITEVEIVNQSHESGQVKAPLQDMAAALHSKMSQASPEAQRKALEILERDKVVRDKIMHMPLCDVPPMPLVGVAAADEREGREYDPNEEKGEVVINATNCRTVTVRGDSAKDYAWDGQQVIIDADRTSANVGKPCVVYTKDGLLRLKRKTKSENGERTYESINREYPPFSVSTQDVLAEWPVVGVITESRVRSPIETVDEGPPPKRVKLPTRRKIK